MALWRIFNIFNINFSSFKHETSGEKVAIKKLKKIFSNLLLAKRSLRELKILRHLSGHPNIVSLKGILLPVTPFFEEM